MVTVINATVVKQGKPAAPVPPLARIEAHYRKFLTTRWAGLVIRAMVVTSVAFFIVPFLLMSSDYTFASLFGSLFILGPLLYLSTVHLVLRARREWIISPPVLPAPASKFSVLLGSFSPATLPLYAAYVTCGAIFALVYAFSLNTRNSAAALGWFNPTPRHQWHLNERLWFIVLGNTAFFFGIAVRDVLRVTYLPKWPKTRQRFPEAVKKSFIACFSGFTATSTFAHDVSNAASMCVVYSFMYFTLRRAAWRWVITYMPFLRPFIINFAKSRSNITWSLAWHLLVVQITTLLALKPALAVLNDYLTQPLNFASFTSRSPLSPDRYLLTALESKNAFYLDHTIMELQRVARSPQRRAAIFADTSKPALVHELWKQLLIQLGNTHATLVARGTTPKPAAAKAAPALAAPDSHSIALKTADIFRPAPKKTGLQKVVGQVLEGTPQPTPAPVLAMAESARRAEADLLRRAEPRVQAAEAWAAGTPVIGQVVATAKLVRGGFSHWAGAEWTRRNVAAAIPEQDRLERLVDVLATLAVASADEDTYGYVQAVLPSTLEALVRLRHAALGLGAELLPQAPKVAPDAEADVRAQTMVVADVLAGGIHRIVERFGRTLQAFRFPGDVALQLTEICKVA